MFNVDLMNSTGLQKIISKGGADNKTKKQKITFQNESYDEINDISSEEKESTSLKPASFLSIFMAVIILGVFLFFGLINVNKSINLSGITKYFKITNNETIAKSTAIKFLSNSEKAKMLKSINIDESLVIKFKTEDISNYKLNKEDASFFMVYDDSDIYNASFSFPLKKKKTSDSKDIIVKNLVMKFQHSEEVFLSIEGRTISFIGGGKDIYDIMDTLFGTGNIEIIPGIRGEYFTLKYSY